MNSTVEEVLLSPDCEFYDTTFPETCNLVFYDYTITINNGNIVQFTLNSDPYELMKIITTITIQRTNNGQTETVTRDLTNFTLSDVDTSGTIQSATGILCFKYGDNTEDVEFTYSVV